MRSCRGRSTKHRRHSALGTPADSDTELKKLASSNHDPTQAATLCSVHCGRTNQKPHTQPCFVRCRRYAPTAQHAAATRASHPPRSVGHPLRCGRDVATSGAAATGPTPCASHANGCRALPPVPRAHSGARPRGRCPAHTLPVAQQVEAAGPAPVRVLCAKARYCAPTRAKVRAVWRCRKGEIGVRSASRDFLSHLHPESGHVPSECDAFLASHLFGGRLHVAVGHEGKNSLCRLLITDTRILEVCHDRV